MSEGRIFTVGHSNRSWGDFLALLRGAGIRAVADVRSHPVSRRFPYFDGDVMRRALMREGLAYRSFKRSLGGRRRARDGGRHPGLEPAWRAYAEHMGGRLFRQGVAELLVWAQVVGPVALMCAEREPERCHRRLIADALYCRGVVVCHLIEAGMGHPHRPDPHLRCTAEGPCYDRQANLALPW